MYQEEAGGARAGTGMARAVARLRDLAGLAGDPRPAAGVLPRGLEGAVLAEVIGAAILHEGAAPEGEERLAVERVVRDMSAPRAWRRVLRRVPSTLPGAADDLAAAVAGRSRRSGSRARPELPPVTRASSVPALRIEGKRLATLGMGWLRLVCHCGHEGKVSVMQLAERHGSDIRVREAIISLRCSHCGKARVREITLLD